MIPRLILLLAVGFALPTCFGQGEKPKPELYSAVAVGTGGPVGGKSMPFDIRISAYTSDSEVQEYATLLKEGGQDALRRALEKLDRGKISPVGRVGNDIAVARKRKSANGTVITIVTARILPFVELYHAGRSTDYPFGFLQVTLNEKGEGMGSMMAAAKIRFNKKKEEYEIESFGNQYIKIVNVRPLK